MDERISRAASLSGAANLSGAASLSGATLSISQRDKDVLAIEDQIRVKTAQLKQDYQRLQRDVKHNPYLQVAIEEYNNYFSKVKADNKEKIKALTKLLQGLEEEDDQNSDIIAIKREIKHIKQN
jgi:hypothetical protein